MENIAAINAGSAWQDICCSSRAEQIHSQNSVCVCACPNSQTENLFEGRVVQIQQSHQELGKGPSFLLFVSFLSSPLFASRRACMGIGMDEIARAPHSSTCCIMKFT